MVILEAIFSNPNDSMLFAYNLNLLWDIFEFRR